jgi:hypothetical protein
MVECGTVEVLAAFDPSAVTVSGCNVTPTTVTEGDTVTATGTVQNGNPDSRAQVTLRFTVSGTSAAETETVLVPAGGSGTGSATFQFTDDGSYPIDVSVDSATEA